MNATKVVRIIQYVFGLVGLLLLAAAVYSYVSTQNFIANAIHARGIVVDLDEVQSSHDGDRRIHYYPVVRYQAEGQELTFKSSVGQNPPGYSVGEEVSVGYLPGNLGSARIDDGTKWLATIVLGILGGVFFLVSAGITLVSWLNRRKENDLKKNGKRILAIFQGVELNRQVTVNGRNPYRIVVQWENPSTSEIHVFNSQNIWFDPSKYIKHDKIPVLIDPQKPRRYLVDISFLPKLAA